MLAQQDEALYSQIQEFYLTSSLNSDSNNDGTLDLIVGQSDQVSPDDDLDEGSEDSSSDQVVTFTATVTDNNGAYINGVLVEFQKLSDFGTLSTSQALTVDGLATTELTVKELTLIQHLLNLY